MSTDSHEPATDGEARTVRSSFTGDELADEGLLVATRLRMHRDKLLSTADAADADTFGSAEIATSLQGLLTRVAGFLDTQAEECERTSHQVREKQAETGWDPA